MGLYEITRRLGIRLEATEGPWNTAPAAGRSIRGPPRLAGTGVRRTTTLVLGFLCWFHLGTPSVAQAKDSDEFFEKRIRPVLATSCHSCHTGSALGGLRVDSREGLLTGGKSGPAIVPGKPEESLLIRAVQQVDEKLKMPMGGKLKDQEIADLVEWVKAGALWPQSKVSHPAASGEAVISAERRKFWSFQPIQKPALPPVQDSRWVKSPIDQFILSRLEAQGLAPVKPADKRTLIRRASLDLTGLPPTPQEVEAFLKDSSPTAFGTVVDRLLASPHYGERWGRYWLDVARYAEDDVRGGSPKGREVYPNAWRYRDWVIKAFNRDMPYDAFVKAQIAGDLLERQANARVDPAFRLAAGTGFLGVGVWIYDNAPPPEGRSNERDDRIDTLTRGLLGLTVACARCHDHKYDPITTKDYYALAGVFASTEYAEYPLVAESEVYEFKKKEKQLKAHEAALNQFIETQSTQLGEILARKTAQYMIGAWTVLGPRKVEVKRAAEAGNLDEETLERWVRYLEVPKKDHPYLKGWNDLLARVGTAEEARKVAEEFQDVILTTIAEKKGVDEENQPIMAQAKLRRSPPEVLLPNRFVTYEDYCPGCSDTIRGVERSKLLLWQDLFVEREKPSEEPSKKSAGVLLYKGEKGEQLERFLSGEWKSHLLEMRAELERLKKEQPAHYPYVHGAGETSHPGNVKLNIRGNPSNLGEEVPRRFLTVLSSGEPEPFRQGSGRLELAEVVANHPLAARVMVNRIWYHHFGRGIVATPSNFGQLGEQPTHPELLEYLADRFIANKYSMKALHREIMLSATYQSSSEFSQDSFKKDPDNRLCWRANHRRLDAEAMRDSLLFVAGTLDPALGGPSAELTDDNRRRTVYTAISRFKPSVRLSTFDFPDARATSEKRNVTNVPLQRLFFLNSNFVWSQAEQFAKRMAEGGGDDAARIKRAYRYLYAREASDSEVRLGIEFLEEAGSSAKEAAPAWQQYAQVLLTANEFLFVD
jgi:cytochrome c553/mono/diheme cytochrome c family protein